MNIQVDIRGTWGLNVPMDQWANGSMGQWINGSMDQWINGLVDQWINGLMDQWVNGLMDQWVNRSVGQWINGSMDQDVPNMSVNMGASPVRVLVQVYADKQRKAATCRAGFDFGLGIASRV